MLWPNFRLVSLPSLCVLALCACEAATDAPRVDASADLVRLTDSVSDRNAALDAPDSARDAPDAAPTLDSVAAPDGAPLDAVAAPDGAPLDAVAPVDVAPVDVAPVDACARTVCGAECVDTRREVRHCGACGSACNAPAHGASRCVDGACGFTCEAGFHACGPSCASNADVTTCGASCAPCVAPAHATASCDGARCDFACDPGFGNCDGNAVNGCESDLNSPATCGVCATRCAEPTPLCGTSPGGARGCSSGCSGATPTRCGTNCVDLATDPRFCGACGTACEGVANGRSTCADGACGFVCDAGFHACGSACLSNTSTASCGSACTACAAPANASATCSGAACGFTCSTGFHLCGGACVSNMATSSCGASCGPCPAPANASATCNGTSCGFACNAGYHLCAGVCVSDASTSSCGSSCSACSVPSNANATCDGRSCGFTCVSGYHVCFGACVVNTAITSCGASCSSCPAPSNGRATCDGTRCGIACNAGFHACGSACASDTDPAACGSACAVCAASANATATCAGGVCGISCATGYGNCNGLASDGCEIDLRTSATNCGACGVSCGVFGVCAAGLCPVLPATTGRAVVPEFGVDDARSGANRAERTLTPANVVSTSFARDAAFSTALDADVYAQPLYVPQVMVGATRRDVLYAVTQSNAVYALDAATGATLWRTTFGLPAVPLSSMYCGNIGPTTGIVGTPVIDPLTWTLYVVGYTTTDGGVTKRFRLHGLDVSTGAARPNFPVVLSPPAVGASRFDPEYTGERGALSVLDGRVYVPFGGLFGDCGTYHGWVVGIDPLTPTRQTAFATPGTGSAVWAPAGFSADSAGRIFLATGNGFTGASRGETVFALATGDSGPTLTDVTANYFVPSDRSSLDSGDVDLGSIAPIPVDHTGSTTPRLLFQSGKAGVGYLLNRDNLGGAGTGNGTTGEGVYSQALFAGGVYGASATFTDASNVYVFVPGRGTRASPCTGSGGVMALRLRLDGSSRSAFSPAWCTASTANSSSPSVSSNGTSNGVLWMATVSPPTLRAYSISDGRELYISSGADSPTSVRQWVPPVVADGRVYVTGTSAIFMYRNR